LLIAAPAPYVPMHYGRRWEGVLADKRIERKSRREERGSREEKCYLRRRVKTSREERNNEGHTQIRLQKS
jgi:hypothetical protein